MKKILLAVAVLAIAAGLIVIPSKVTEMNGKAQSGGPGGPGGPGMPGAARRDANTVFTVRTADAVIRSLEAYIEINGDIVSEEQVTVVPEAGGKLVFMRPDIGSTVYKGDLIAQVDPSRPGSQYSLSPVYAPVSGVVVSNPLSVGSTVSTATALFTIASAGSLQIEAMVPEREVGQLRTGLQAEVRLEAFPGEVFAARVTRLSPVVDPTSRAKKVILRFINNDRRINAGMFARLKLKTRAYENVVSIPQEAVVENRGATVVYVLDGGGETPRAAMREVTVGVSVDGETEIKAGLAAGEQVVVQGQQFLTDGAAVRVIGAASTGSANKGA